jgi:phage regulator Rha-like protein
VLAQVDPHVASKTSQDIADLVGSCHNNVNVSIERLADRGVIQLPPMGDVKNSGGQAVRQYLFQGEQGKRDSIIVVAQLSPEFTAALVESWQELEDEKGQTLYSIDAISARSAALDVRYRLASCTPVSN